MTDVSKSVGFRPPAPHAEQSGKVVPRVPSNAIPGTAGSIDPIADSNATLPLGKTRADFRTNEFDRVLLQHGKRVIWRKAMICPCITLETDQVAVDCTECDGSGFIYLDPLEISALMLAFEKSTRMYEKFGTWVAGETSITTQAPYRLGWRDSIEMIDDLMNFNEIIKKGNRRGPRASLPANTDAARYRIAQITKALVKIGKGSVVSLEIGYHITLNESGHIQWLAAGNAAVPDGTSVSVHYDFHPVWIVTSHPHAQRSDTVARKSADGNFVGLPLQASAQLDYLSDSVRSAPVTGSL